MKWFSHVSRFPDSREKEIMRYYGRSSSCSLFQDRLKAGNPCNLLRKPGLPRLPDQKQPEILEALSLVSLRFFRGEVEGTEFYLGLCLP